MSDMSIVGYGKGGNLPTKPGENLSPVLLPFEMLDIEKIALEIMEAGVASKAIEASTVRFASVLVGEGREPAIVLPTLNLLTRHKTLVAIEDPETRPDEVFVAQVESEPKIQKHHLPWDVNAKTPLHKVVYYSTGTSNFSARNSITSNVVAGQTAEEVEKALEINRLKNEKLKALDGNEYYGNSARLLEAAFGGIDITAPEQAVREFSARMLLSSLVERIHKGSHYSPDFDDDMLCGNLKLFFIRQYHSDYDVMVKKLQGAAHMVTVGETIDPVRVSVVNDMVVQDVEVFLAKTWKDLERLVAIARLGESDIRRVLANERRWAD